MLCSSPSDRPGLVRGMQVVPHKSRCFCFFNDTPTTEIYTLPLHDALPISSAAPSACLAVWTSTPPHKRTAPAADRSEEHTSELQSPYVISYAVFCLQK